MLQTLVHRTNARFIASPKCDEKYDRLHHDVLSIRRVLLIALGLLLLAFALNGCSASTRRHRLPNLRSGPCGLDDAFYGVSLETFKFPEEAPANVGEKWEEAFAAMRARLTAFPYGGKPLRAMVHIEATEIRALRHDIFCRYLPRDYLPSDLALRAQS
jgi:hypothetical protein